MEDDISNGVVILIEDEDSIHSAPTLANSKGYLKGANGSRPLMSLFERLITNNKKSMTILTNPQILAILDKEFDMKSSNLHDLEIDIYINIVKKFLKDWPQWDIFDQTMNKMKKRGSDDEIKYILEQNYKDLKVYLRTMIDIATPLAKEAVKKAKSLPEPKRIEDNSDIVLEVHCTRKMLNSFIYNRPNPAECNSVFNLLPYEPMKLHPSAPTYTFPTLLNWYGVRLMIKLPFFQYTRNTAHRLNHVLVNENNGPRDLKEELDVSVYMKSSNTITKEIIILNITRALDKIMAHYKKSIEFEMIKSICNVIKNDLDFDISTVEIPGSYKRRLNKYPYVRKLFSEVEGSTSPHNLYMEEKIIPMQDWHIGKFVHTTKKINMPALENWLKFECGECKQKFHGAKFLTLLQEHFKVYHVDEPDWTCVNCQKSFTMAEITNKGWKHDC